MFGFVGRNGAGKTTTMRIVCGLLAAEAGSVRWRGEPIDARVRERIGYMPEERGLYPKMRTRDQLEYFGVLHGLPRMQARAASSEWLERLGLGDRAASSSAGRCSASSCGTAAPGTANSTTSAPAIASAIATVRGGCGDREAKTTS